MEFTLHYRGELRSNGRPEHKHELRRHFHRQLKDLWNHLPLSVFYPKLVAATLVDEPKEGQVSLVRKKQGYTFVPLVSESVALVAELTVLLLWPAAPGAIVSSGGDIDNRLKTLLDSLKYPSEANALPPESSPSSDESPFFCLLEDDSLITKLSVETDRLLEPVNSKAEVELTIRVHTRQLKVMYATIGLA